MKTLSGTLSGCQAVWIKIRTNIQSVQIWVQTVCKDYQQTTNLADYRGETENGRPAQRHNYSVWYPR